MKKILFLGGSSQQVIAIETAKLLGMYTILCDYLIDNPGQYSAEKFYLISTTDKEAVLQVAKEENVDYIIAYASDPAAPVAAFVAEQLGLPTNPYKAVNTLCNKSLFREFLSSHGFNTPKAIGFNDKDKALEQINSFGFPIIIKPVDSSGSKGVSIIHNFLGIDDAIDYAFSFSRIHRIIIEEYIEKKHPYLIGGDVFVSDGIIVQWGLMNCHRDSNVNPLVPVGKSYPPILSQEDMKNVKRTLQKIVDELGIRFGPMNVELIIDKQNRVFPIDIGPRCGGNLIPDLLSMIFDCNEVEMCINAAMGKRIEMNRSQGKPYYATHNLHTNKTGRFLYVEISEEIERYIVRKEVYKKRGDPVSFFSNASFAIGIIFFKFPDQNTMIYMQEHMNNYIHIAVE